MEILLVISGILQLAKTLISDASKAAKEGRDLSADEQARLDLARKLVEEDWAALAPKD